MSFLPLCLAIAACGGGGSSDSGNDDGNSQQPPANTAPSAVDDAATASIHVEQITIDVLANDSDSDGDALTIASAAVSSQGVTPRIENGVIVYTIAENLSGSDEFTYTITDGELEASATVTVTFDAAMTISGLVGEVVSGPGSVVVMVGEQQYTAALDGSRFGADVQAASPSDVVTVRAEFPSTDIGKPIVLKSYAGIVSQLSDLSTDGRVTEAEAPALYLSAATTGAAAIVERAAAAPPATADELIRASQLLPQHLVLENAIALKSILAGDSWDSFTQQDTYALLTDYPAAIRIAEALREQDAARYEEYRAAIVNDPMQSLPVPGYENAELVFLQTSIEINRPGGFVLQLSGGTSGEGHLAMSSFRKNDDNAVTFSVSGRDTLVDVSGLYPSAHFGDHREECAPDENGRYQATQTGMTLRKYLDSGTFSAYEVWDTFSCDSTSASFELQSRLAQVNAFTSGDVESLTQDSFAISTYLDRDPAVYSGSYLWQAVTVEPNPAGSVTQRFDFNSGYTDDGSISYLAGERLALNMNRGDYIEYIPLGMDGVALRTMAVLKRADGSAASAFGDFLVPITSNQPLPLPAKLVYTDTAFSIYDTASAYYYTGFGFEFLSDGTGYQLYRPTGAYERTATGFSWAQENGYLDMRYYVDRTDYTFPPSCEESNTNCVEWRFREFEPLAADNDGYFIRVYQEADYSKLWGQEPGTDVFSSSYIERFSVTP